MTTDRAVAYERVEGTVWPVPVTAEWVLRYATPDVLLTNRFGLASIAAAYWSLIDPTQTKADARAKLERARQAAKQHLEGPHSTDPERADDEQG